MIKKFRHKGLEAFSESGTLAGIQPTHARRLRSLLNALSAASEASDMHRPGYRLHRSHGVPTPWSVWVSGNWRLTFQFQDGKAHNVDYEDYH